MPEPPDPDETEDGDDEYDTTYAKSVLAYGGVVSGPDGKLHTMPEHEALAGAIPQWVELAQHEADALDACLEFASHDHPVVRAASVAAFGDLADRYGRLGQRERVVRAIELALRDRDEDVRAAAARSAAFVEQTLGWRVARPGA